MRVILLILALLALCVPLAAQGTDSVAYNGIEFELDQSLAAGVQLLRFPGDDPSVQQPGGAVPPHLAFTFLSGIPNAETNTNVGEMHVYNTADFTGYTTAETEFANLSGLLSTRPDLSAYTQVDMETGSFTLPYLPGIGASQVIRAKPQYIETEFLTGVRYLAIYSQDASPFTADRMWYTFQGVSRDSSRYVAVTFWLNSSVLPADIPADFNYDDFNANYMQYLADTVTLLNNAADETFAPSPLTLDALVQSIRLPAPQDTVAGGEDASLGGLVGTWNLVSYGDPAAPTPVLENAPITLVFAPDGISGQGSCNSYFGQFTFDDGIISISGVGSTLMACEQPILDQETAYFAALSAAHNYTLDGDTLTISYGANDSEVLPGVLNFTRPL